MLRLVKQIIGSFFPSKQACDSCGNWICKNNDDYFGDNVCKCGQIEIETNSTVRKTLSSDFHFQPLTSGGFR